jgi:tetratricopeptide (TPR) repeat protein
MRAAALVLVLLACAAVDAAAPTKPDAMAQAELLLDAAGLSHDATERFRLADEAAAICERAAKDRPRDPEPILKLVRALTVADPDHPEACRPGRCEQALGALERMKRVDPLSLEAARIASEEGILLSRMGRFAEAMLAYERALPLIEPMRRANSLDERPQSVLLWGNSAETAMALGRLDDAIRRYEIAIDHAVYGEREWQLALWGLAIALDRDGQVERARTTVRRALERDPALTALHDEGVFFAPAGDLYYYEGLGHEVAGDRVRARAAFGKFLGAQPASRYAGRARSHLADLAKPGREWGVGEATVSVGKPLSEHRRRDPEAVQRAVRAHVAELRVCYERYLREHAGQTIATQLAVDVLASGFVGPARTRILSINEPSVDLSRCIELSAEGWRFPILRDGEELWLIPLDFSPPRTSFAAPR